MAVTVTNQSSFGCAVTHTQLTYVQKRLENYRQEFIKQKQSKNRNN